MGRRAVDLAERFKVLNDDLIGFVRNCSEEDWRKVCPGEHWSVGVVTRHIAASHYGAVGLVKMMIAGEKLPELTREVIDHLNSRHAEKYCDCTRDEVLETLRENGVSAADYMAGLSDADLDRKAHVPLAGGDMTAEQIIQFIVLRPGGEHFASVKAATGA